MSNTKKPRKNFGGRHNFYNYVVKDGKRDVEPIKYPKKSEECDLISTTFENPDGSDTLFCLTFDFDYLKASPTWHKKDGSGLDHKKMLEQIKKEIPGTFEWISYIVESYSGRGLHLMISISPIQLFDNCKNIKSITKVLDAEKCAKAARKLQYKLLELFNSFRFGCDQGALGLKRRMANFKNQNKVKYKNEISYKKAYIERPSIISMIFTELNNLAFFKYDPKKYDKSLLAPDYRIEKKVADVLLYVDTHKTVYFNSMEEFGKFFDLDYRTINHNLKKKKSWLIIEKRKGKRGVFVQLDTTFENFAELKQRAYLLREEIIEPEKGLQRFERKLKSPYPKPLIPILITEQEIIDLQEEEKVISNINKPLVNALNEEDPKDKGNTNNLYWSDPTECLHGRNEFFYKSAVKMRTVGYCQNEATLELIKIREEIPGFQYSKSCRVKSIVSVVRSIFKTARSYNFSPLVEKKGTKSRNLHKIKRSPGGAGVFPAVYRSVGLVKQNGFISFDGSSYSVPIEFIGKKLKIDSTSSRLTIHDGKNYIASHKRTFLKNSYVENRRHAPSPIQKKEIFRKMVSGFVKGMGWEKSENAIDQLANFGLKGYDQALRLMRREFARKTREQLT